MPEEIKPEEQNSELKKDEPKKEKVKAEILESEMMNPKPEREVPLEPEDVQSYKELLMLKMAYKRAMNELIQGIGAHLEEANLHFWENMNKKYKLDPKKQAVVNIRRNVLKEFPAPPPASPMLPPGMFIQSQKGLPPKPAQAAAKTPEKTPPTSPTPPVEPKK